MRKDYKYLVEADWEADRRERITTWVLCAAVVALIFLEVYIFIEAL